MGNTSNLKSTRKKSPLFWKRISNRDVCGGNQIYSKKGNKILDLWSAFLDEEINELNDRLAGLQQIKDHEKDRYEAELQKLRTDYQEMKDQLTSENMILGEIA